jgi:hypothetical protein
MPKPPSKEIFQVKDQSLNVDVYLVALFKIKANQATVPSDF